MDRVKAFLETYRVWPQADIDLERELTGLVDDLEQVEAFLDELVRNYRLHELGGSDNLSDQEAVAKAATVLDDCRRIFDNDQNVDLFGGEHKAELQALLKNRDELEVFRQRILGAVKKAGALDMKAYPDDNHLVILVEALFP